MEQAIGAAGTKARTVLEPVGDHLVAFGLEWRRLTGLNRKGRSMTPQQETAQYAAEIQGGARLGIRVRRSSGPTVVGLLPNAAMPGEAAGNRGKRQRAGRRKASRIFAGAEVFAASIKEANAALVVVLGQGGYAFIGIRDRLPAVGFDVVGGAAEVLGVARDFIRRVKETGVSFYFVGEPGPEFDTALFHPNSSLPDLFAPANLAAHGPAALVQLRKGGLVVPLSILVVAVAVGSYVYDDYKVQEAKKAQIRSRQAAQGAANREVDPAAVYEQSVLALVGNVPPASVAAVGFMASVGPLPGAAMPGWDFARADCANQACTVTWRRSSEKDRATNEALSQARGQPLIFLPDLMSANETLVVQGDSSAIVDIGALPAPQDFLRRAGSRFQVMKRAGLAVTLVTGNDGKGGMTIVGTWPGGNPPPAGAKLVRSGTWEISGDYGLRIALQELPANMVLTSMLVEKPQAPLADVRGGHGGQPQVPVVLTTPSVKFTAKGIFYVR